MAYVYVAGKNLARAQTIMAQLREHGHHITYDWATSFSDKNPKEKAISERDGVRQADVLVYLWEEDQESARYETGMAMGLEKPIVISGTKDSFFFQLPNIIRIESDNQIVSAIETLLSHQCITSHFELELPHD